MGKIHLTRLKVDVMLIMRCYFISCGSDLEDLWTMDSTY